MSDRLPTKYLPAGQQSHLHRGVSGIKVTHSRDSSQHPSAARTELMFTLEVAEPGAAVSTKYVDYESDGKPYTLVLHWRMIACCNAITDPDMCADG